MDTDEEVRAPDAVFSDQLIGSDTVDDRIAQLMSQGLDYDEAHNIAKDQARDYVVEDLKTMDEYNRLENTRKLEEIKGAKELEMEKSKNMYKTIVFGKARFLQPSNSTKLKEAYAYFEKTGHPLELSDADYESINDELNEIVKKKRMTSDESDKILELFTTPVNEDEDYEYNEEGGGRKRRRKSRKNKKRRYTKKGKRRPKRKSRKGRKSRRY